MQGQNFHISLTNFSKFNYIIPMSNNAFSLVVKIAGQDPVKHDLEADSITFGRGPDNGIQVLVAEVSVKHGELEKSGDTYKIADHGSSNGTTVNGSPVNSDGTELAPMDKILLGSTTPAFFVPTAIAGSGSLEELIAGIEAAPKGAPVTAPVAVAAAVAPATPGKPAPLQPAAVKPAAVAPAAPGKPAPLQPAAVKPAAVAPAPVAGASTVKLEQVQVPKPGVAAPAGPVAPKVGGAPAPMKPPGAAPVAPAAPAAPSPGGPPAPAAMKPPGAVPAPVPLKKVEPKAPSIPLPPKKP